MKNLFVVLIGVLMVGTVAFAQTPIQPPRALIYKAPVKADLKEYRAKDGSFTITFSCVPKISTKEIETAFVTETKCYRSGSNSIVRIWKFDVELDNDDGKMFDIFKDSMLKTPNKNVISEKDHEIDGDLIREFEVVEDIHFHKIRLIVAGQQLIELRSDVTNWQILSAETKNEFLSDAERFFGSFRLSAESNAASNEVPDEILGTISKSRYTNRFFDFSIEIPESWIIYTDEEVKLLQGVGIEALSDQDQKKAKALRDLVAKEVLVFSASSRLPTIDRLGNLGIGVVKQPSSAIDAKTVAQVTRDFFIKNHGYLIVEDIRTLNINGKTFATFTVKREFGQQILHQKFYCTMSKSFSAQFVISYSDNDSLKEIEALVLNLGSAKL